MKFKPLPLYADCSKNLIKNPSKSLTIFPQCSDFDFMNKFEQAVKGLKKFEQVQACMIERFDFRI